MRPDPESDVDPDGESNLDNPEGDNDDETVVPATGAVSKKTVGKVIRQCTSHGREGLPFAKILVDQSWLGCFPMALPDQLATLAVQSRSRHRARAPSPSIPFPPRDDGPSPEYP